MTCIVCDQACEMIKKNKKNLRDVINTIAFIAHSVARSVMRLRFSEAEGAL